MSKKKLKSDFDSWKKENDQHGRQAFSRYIMLRFLDGLQAQSDDFIFKGGNLLWHYIKTPRETIDLDLSTQTLKSHLEIKSEIEKSFTLHDEIKFKVKEFKEAENAPEIGAVITLEYETLLNQKNQFTIDVVYALPTDISLVKSTISGKSQKSASIENIIADKLEASYRFKSANTRMKDFDDLWRISKSDLTINGRKLNRILKARNICSHLELEWVSFLEQSWKKHSKSYEDIPKDLNFIFTEINCWINGLLC